MEKVFKNWQLAHKEKKEKILKKLLNFSKDEIIQYFTFENMKEKELDFCLLYKQNKKCHNLKDLNCYFCACPYFKVEKHKTLCLINSRFAKYKKDKNGYISLSCIDCKIPHNKNFVKKQII
jgi:Zn-finger protein